MSSSGNQCIIPKGYFSAFLTTDNMVNFSLAVGLLASQVVVIIALIVLCKKFKTLKDELDKYRLKANRKSLPKLVVQKPTDEGNNRPMNEYVDGRRPTNTLVRSSSQESIVYVPTPTPERRSRNLNEEEIISGIVPGQGSLVTPYIEEIHENNGFTRENEDEIYGNQIMIDMKTLKRNERYGNGVQENTSDSTRNALGRSGNLDEEEDSSEMNTEENFTEDPSTPHIEEINENDYFARDSEEEIYGNQEVIDARNAQSVKKSSSGVQSNTSRNYAGRVKTEAVQDRWYKFGKRQKMNEQKQTSTESESTMEAVSSSFCNVHNDSDNRPIDIVTEPIYENLKDKSFA